VRRALGRIQLSLGQVSAVRSAPTRRVALFLSGSLEWRARFNHDGPPRLPRPSESTRGTSMANPNCILRLKVTREIAPPIWRRLEIPSDFTLARLHRVLQVAMGWTDSHLHQFLAGEDRYGPLDSEMQENQRDEGATSVGDVLRSSGDRLGYKYDFGDGWEHEIVLEGILIPDTGVSYPICVGGERACPPEDCGGIPGYSDFLQAVRDPSHPEHAELIEWVGGTFDPESFSVEGVNRLLRSRSRKARA